MKRFILVITRGRNGRSQFFDLGSFFEGSDLRQDHGRKAEATTWPFGFLARSI